MPGHSRHSEHKSTEIFAWSRTCELASSPCRTLRNSLSHHAFRLSITLGVINE